MTIIRPTPLPTLPDHEVIVTSPFLRIRTAPRFGAKLTELRSLNSGRDWLWKNPRQLMRQGKPFADYVGEFDSGGWDELFPTVSPVPPGVDLGQWGADGLTDHGELWYRAWKTAQAGPHRCTQTVDAAADEFRFQRQILLDRSGPRATVRYELEHLGRQPMPFVWAAHPLFRCEPTMSIEVDGSTPIEAVQCHGDMCNGVPTATTWGELFDRYPVLNAADGWTEADTRCGLTLKIFLRTEPDQPVSLVHRATGEKLSVRHDGGMVTHTAIWLNLGGWSGDDGERHQNIGIEPTTFPGDVPPHNPAPQALLCPGELREWSLGLSVEPA